MLGTLGLASDGPGSGDGVCCPFDPYFIFHLVQ